MNISELLEVIYCMFAFIYSSIVESVFIGNCTSAVKAQKGIVTVFGGSKMLNTVIDMLLFD